MTVPFDYLPFSSLAAYGHHEASTHKYVCSWWAKTDLGASAYGGWFDNYWVIFYHHRWIQHLFGERPFPEFKQGNYFGRIRWVSENEVWARHQKLCPVAVKYVLEKFLLLEEKPWENLDFILHEDEIRASGMNYEEVRNVLTEFGINECRICWKEIFHVDECTVRDEFQWCMDKLCRLQSA